MIKNVYFNAGGSGGQTGRVILPSDYLKLMNVTKDDPRIEITYENERIIIKKAEKLHHINNR
jgi:antitoxin component of MazEF toxin-antitoxin module